MIALVATLLTVQGGITVENPGIRLELFLKELSKQANTELHCPTYLNNEVIVASFENQPLETIKKQLARVVNGVWDKKESGWWLIQTSDQKKEEQRIFQSARGIFLQDQLTRVKNALPKTKWTQKEAQQFWADLQSSRVRTGEGTWTSARRRALRLQAPESRCAIQILSLLTPQIFECDPSKPDNRRFAVQGLPSHVEIPIDIGPIMAQFDEEHDLLNSMNANAISTGRPIHVEITVANYEIPIPEFIFYDQSWQGVGSAIPTVFFPMSYTAKGESFPVSKEIQTIQARLANQNPETLTQACLDLDIPNVFQHAHKTDPLGILQGRCWIDFAHFTKKPVLVDLEDDPGIRRPRAYVPAIEQEEPVVGMKRIDADGWVLGCPRNPQRNRVWRIDRSLIESIATKRSSKLMLNIGEAFDLADKLSYIELYTTGIPNGNLLERNQEDANYVLGAIGSLPLGRIKDIINGGSVSVSELPARGQDYLWYLYNLGELNELGGRPDKELELCPRVALPNGLAGMTLSATLSGGPIYSFTEDVSAFTDDGEGMIPLQFAQIMKKAIKDSSPLLTKKFLISTVQTIDATVSLNGRKTSLPKEIGRMNSPEYTWSTFPDAIRKQLLDSVKDSR